MPQTDSKSHQQLSIKQLLSKAKKSAKKGDITLAIELYQSILQTNPEHPVAKKSLRKLLSNPSSKKTVSVNPPPEKMNVLIDLYHSGDMKRTELFCKDLLQTYHNSFDLINILGASYLVQNKLQNALQVYEQLIQIKPDFAEAHYNCGNVLNELGQFQEAINSYDSAIQIKPDFAESYCNRGNSLKALEKLHEALESYNKAIYFNPTFAEAYSNRGGILKELNQLEEAIKSCDQALHIKPDYAEAFSNKGIALKNKGELQAAIENYDKAIQLKPDFTEAYHNLCMDLHYIYGISPSYIYEKHQDFAQKFDRNTSKNLKKNDSARLENKRLKVGYVSADFHAHPVSYFFEPLLMQHDVAKFEIYCFYNHKTIDEVTERIRSKAEHWYDISNLNDQQVVNLIQQNNIDILIDLAGHTYNNRLLVFTYKPTPIQVTWLGYFNTTGLNAVDYLVGDPYVTPIENEKYFSEKIWRLPTTRWCFSQPTIEVSVGPLPSIKNGYITFGCFNNSSKINIEVIKLWSNILKALPKSKLFLKSKQYDEKMIRDSLIKKFNENGVATSKLIIEGEEFREKYLSSYHHVDIGLDPFPFTGGTTTVESLWMGVPVLTLQGNSMVTNQGVGILMNCALSKWIAKDKNDYMNKAIDFSSDLGALNNLRQGMRKKIIKEPLFDSVKFTQNFEDALQGMWLKYIGT